MPIIYVDKSKIREGKVEAVRSRIAELAAFVEANHPRIVAYAAYIDGDRDMTVIHVHTDAKSLAYHMNIGGPLFRGFSELLEVGSIDVYGEVGDEIAGQLRDKAAMLGGGAVRTHASHAGFVRSSPA